MVDLLQYFPYDQPREIQAQSLDALSRNWDRYDVFVLSAPTAYGKTAIARTLMNAFKSVSCITPTNMLVDQFLAEFPETPTLRRLDSYHCEEWDRPCASTRGKLRKFCKGCPAGGALATVKYRSGPGIYTYHMYLAQKLHRDVLVVDEAHNLIPFLRDRLALRMWQHDYKYPSNMYTSDQMSNWLRGVPPTWRKRKIVATLEDAISSRRPQHIAKRDREWFNGKGTVRGDPEERDCLRLLPVDLGDVPPMLWPGLGKRGTGVQKLVLLSATISRKDVETLGLDRGGRRVLYIECESPIPPNHRPIISLPVVAVNRSNLISATKEIADYIESNLAPKHLKEKGLIHATYQQASILSEYLSSNPRYLFHTTANKSDVYARFRSLPADSGAVLIASGMYEGIDLPEDLGRWQVISKMPWPSLGNPAVKYLSERDPDWYSWEVWKSLIQACGRICRTPKDYGVSYILDASFQRLLRDSDRMMPKWFSDALEIV